MEARSVNLSEAELLDALREAFDKTEDHPDGAYTTVELAEMMGCNTVTMQRRLKRLIEAGEAECIRIRRTAIDGRMAVVPAYRVKIRRAA